MELSRRQVMILGSSLLTLGSGCIEAKATPNGGHVVLLGDSIFDNKSYIADGPAVIEQLRMLLPKDWQATLGARDGAVAADVEHQADGMSLQGAHVFVSAGGNDALRKTSILGKRVQSSAQVFSELADISAVFKSCYQKMVESVIAHGCHTTLCTIYDPNFSDPKSQRNAKAALTIFNDCITRTAVKFGLPIIDLRTVFNQRGDYANHIEPSPIGGLKMAKLIRQISLEHDFNSGGTRIYT